MLVKFTSCVNFAKYRQKKMISFSFTQVSKWKLYKTARKRGIYAEIKKQNQAQVRSNFDKMSD